MCSWSSSMETWLLSPFLQHVHDLKLKPSKVTVHSSDSLSLSHTHTHRNTLTHINTRAGNFHRPATDADVSPLHPPPQINLSAMFLLHKSCRKRPLNDGRSPVDSTQLAAAIHQNSAVGWRQFPALFDMLPNTNTNSKIPQIHIYTNISGPWNTGGRLTIYNASFLYMPRIKLF